MQSTEPLCWNFVLHSDGSWSCQRVHADGRADPGSGPHADFAKAVADALRLGFDPERHVWVVEHRRWSTRYAPGARPVNSARNPREATRGGSDGTLLPEQS